MREPGFYSSDCETADPASDCTSPPGSAAAGMCEPGRLRRSVGGCWLSRPGGASNGPRRRCVTRPGRTRTKNCGGTSAGGGGDSVATPPPRRRRARAGRWKPSRVCRRPSRSSGKHAFLGAVDGDGHRNPSPIPADRATHAVARPSAPRRSSCRSGRTCRSRTSNFCHRVDSFGNVPGRSSGTSSQPNEPVLIYAAVENFTSERTLRGPVPHPVLRSKVEIFRAGGTQLVETLPLDKPTTVDLCDNHRQDYFLIYELKIPAPHRPRPARAQADGGGHPRRGDGGDGTELHREVRRLGGGRP